MSTRPLFPFLPVLALWLSVDACKKNQPPAEPARSTEATPPPAPPPTQPAAAPEPATPAPPPAQAPAPADAGPLAALMKPANLTEKAPATFKARFETSKGPFVIQVRRDWAPEGADRFYNLVKNGYYDGLRFFRAIKGFMVQFGIHGDPGVNTVWREARIPDDPVGKKSNKRGFVTFAKGGPDSRTTQIFINFTDNDRLDAMGFPPFGEVVSGMKVVDSLYTDYGEGQPQGMGPEQMRLQAEGNAYLDRDFPQLDSIKKATIVR